MYFFHGRNTLNDLVYHSSSYFTRVLFDRDSHSGVLKQIWEEKGWVPTVGGKPQMGERGSNKRGVFDLFLGLTGGLPILADKRPNWQREEDRHGGICPYSPNRHPFVYYLIGPSEA